MPGFIPNTEMEQKEMLGVVGVNSMDQLFDTIPDSVKLHRALDLPKGMSEMEVSMKMSQLSGKNMVYPICLRGAGAYRHYIPSVVKDLSSKKEFVTAYTPYQAEISQGILQAIFEYQSIICELTDMDASNASVYDGATAVAEAIAMCTDRKKQKVVISGTINPEAIAVVKTWCRASDVEIITIPQKGYLTDMDALKENLNDDIAAVVLQSPNYYGGIEDMKKGSELAHDYGAKFIASVNPISLGLLKPPGDYDADIAVGDGQPLGNPMAFGGPYLGFMATHKKMMRKLPGRIVGQSVDHEGKRGFVLTLQAREQHIRREKASSNICSNQALNALTAAVYLSAVGPQGLRDVAQRCMDNALYLAAQLQSIPGVAVPSYPFFHEFVTESQIESRRIMDVLAQHNVLGGLPLDDSRILWCTTEMNQRADMDLVVSLVKEVATDA